MLFEILQHLVVTLYEKKTTTEPDVMKNKKIRCPNHSFADVHLAFVCVCVCRQEFPSVFGEENIRRKSCFEAKCEYEKCAKSLQPCKECRCTTTTEKKKGIEKAG